MCEILHTMSTMYIYIYVILSELQRSIKDKLPTSQQLRNILPYGQKLRWEDIFVEY